MAKMKYAHDLIVSAIKEGKTYTEIAAVLDCDRNTVSEYCRKVGIAYCPKDKLRQSHSLIKELLKRGVSAVGVAQEVGCALSTVYKVGCETGHVFKGHNMMAEHGDEVLALVRGGETFDSVAKRFGCSKTAVADYCHKWGVRSDWEGGNQWGDYDKRLCRAVKVIEKHLPMFEYAGGFTDTDSPVLLRCTVCGVIRSASMISVRKSKVTCEVCVRRKREIARAEKEAAREAVKEKKARDELLQKLKSWEQISFRFCGCGSALPAAAKGDLCPACRKKEANRKREQRRRVKVKGAWVDSDITVSRLYQRDGGACWLCGRQCDLEDWVLRDGVIVCGNMYPSIDHVTPLSKGGRHAWENVKLAHRVCNSLKGDKTYPPRVSRAT